MSIDPNPKNPRHSSLEFLVIAFSLLLAFLGFLGAGAVLFDVFIG